jgi:predicted deacylase
MNKPFKICGEEILPGTRKRVHLHVAKLYDITEMKVPIEVIHGEIEGPTLFVCAAIHGDEINGVEVIRRLNLHSSLRHIKGTLLLIPIVNVFGFNSQTRYMPDRRDLNRSFPGSPKGSLTSQLANLFMEEVVTLCTHGIDLHTAGCHRTNLPQIRANIDSDEIRELASSFGAPLILDSATRDGSLRQAGTEKGIPILLFEGGTALRYNQHVIRIALSGILSTMESLGMIKKKLRKKKSKEKDVYIAKSNHWIRAPVSGSVWRKTHLGNKVKKGDIIGIISDPFGKDNQNIVASHSGIIIGYRIYPLVNKGDAVFNVATFKEIKKMSEEISSWNDLPEWDEELHVPYS